MMIDDVIRSIEDPTRPDRRKAEWSHNELRINYENVIGFKKAINGIQNWNRISIRDTDSPLLRLTKTSEIHEWKNTAHSSISRLKKTTCPANTSVHAP